MGNRTDRQAMRALTLWQPHAWAIAHAGKRVENRGWPPPSWVIGQPVAIHAGKRLEPGVAEAMELRGIEAPDSLVFGAVAAVATVQGYRMGAVDLADPLWLATPEREAAGDQRRWFTGPYGWLLSSVVALPTPVPCRGYQKLWTLPEEIEEAVVEQWKKAEPGWMCLETGAR